MRFVSRFLFPTFLLLVSLHSVPSMAQDWVRIGSNLGNTKIRIAAADFKPVGADPQTPS
jgi:TolB protein